MGSENEQDSLVGHSSSGTNIQGGNHRQSSAITRNTGRDVNLHDAVIVLRELLQLVASGSEFAIGMTWRQDCNLTALTRSRGPFAPESFDDISEYITSTLVRYQGLPRLLTKHQSGHQLALAHE